MKDRFGRIFRCKVRDPSMFNWQALVVAVSEPEHQERSPIRRKSRPIIADFPLINKSFGLSYAGYDL
jgi:Ni,Fe-hydrogenase III large subunit